MPFLPGRERAAYTSNQLVIYGGTQSQVNFAASPESHPIRLC
jgi:hypothetical protein